jgi:hypothetical protein
MEIIDELRPFTDKDIKYLESVKTSSERGCAIVFFGLAAIVVVAAYALLIQSYLIWTVVGLICLVLVLAGLLLLVKTDDRKIVQDLKEGNKRRIVAPIEDKQAVEVPQRRRSYGTTGQLIRSTVGPELRYFMTVKGIRIDLSEEAYLTGPGKGDFVEFYIAPHSKKILSAPIEVREE